MEQMLTITDSKDCFSETISHHQYDLSRNLDVVAGPLFSFFSSFVSSVRPHLAQNFASRGFLCLHMGHTTVGILSKAVLAFTKTTSPILSICSNGSKASSSSLNSIITASLPSLDQARSFDTPIFFASPSITSLPTISSRLRHCTKTETSSEPLGCSPFLEYLALCKCT